MKKRIFPLLAMLLLAGCGTESGVDMVNDTPVIWDSSNPDTAESLTYTDYGEAVLPMKRRTAP